MDKYKIEEWQERSDTAREFVIFERVGYWPFRRWEERGRMPTLETAKLFMRDKLVGYPKLRSTRWFNGNGGEYMAW